MKAYRAIPLLISILVFSVFSRSYSQTIETVDGIKTIRNKDVKTQNLDNNEYLEFVRKIGDMEGSDENLLFYLPADMIVDNEDNIYILDVGNYRVQKFDYNLNFLLSFGGKGQGPGEFLFMGRMNLNSKGELVISENRQKKYEVFDRNGKWLRSFKTENHYGQFILNYKDQILGYGNSVTLMSPLGKDSKIPDEPLIDIYDEAQKLKGIGRKINLGNLVANSAANSNDITEDRENNIYISYRYLNKIDKYSPEGDILFRIVRRLNFETYDITNDKFGMMDFKAASEKSAKMLYISKAIAVDSEDRIWVVTYNRQAKPEEASSVSLASYYGIIEANPSAMADPYAEIENTDMYDLEVYTSEGKLLTKIRLDHFVNNLRIFGNKLFILDSMHSMQIYEYRIKDIN